MLDLLSFGEGGEEDAQAKPEGEGNERGRAVTKFRDAADAKTDDGEPPDIGGINEGEKEIAFVAESGVIEEKGGAGGDKHIFLPIDEPGADDFLDNVDDKGQTENFDELQVVDLGLGAEFDRGPNEEGEGEQAKQRSKNENAAPDNFLDGGRHETRDGIGGFVGLGLGHFPGGDLCVDAAALCFAGVTDNTGRREGHAGIENAGGAGKKQWEDPIPMIDWLEFDIVVGFAGRDEDIGETVRQ